MPSDLCHKLEQRFRCDLENLQEAEQPEKEHSSLKCPIPWKSGAKQFSDKTVAFSSSVNSRSAGTARGALGWCHPFQELRLDTSGLFDRPDW
jgi:hypothetical protein